MRSLFAGVSGLRAHQEMMDVVGDNIANVNTAGFQASSVVFEDTLSQLMRGGSAPGEQDASGLSQPGGGSYTKVTGPAATVDPSRWRWGWIW